MSDKSSEQERHEGNDNSSSSSQEEQYQQQNQQEQQNHKNPNGNLPLQMQLPIPQNDMQRGMRRTDNNPADELWTLPFAASPFTQFQTTPHGFPQIQNLQNFSLSKPPAENLFEEFVEGEFKQTQANNVPQDRRQTNPFRKVSGPMDMMMNQDQQNNEEDNLNPTGTQGTQNQQIKSQPPNLQQQQQYMQQQQQLFRMPQFMPPQFQMPMKNQQQQLMYQPYPPFPMYNNNKPPFPQFFYPSPFPNNTFMPQNFPNGQDSTNYSVANTVSKELSNKVCMIVQQTQISTFQCNCKKSKCLKLYCECFANGQVCSQSCNCLDCKNRIDNQQERQKAIEEALIRNNDAFNKILNGKSQIGGVPPQPQQAIQQQQLIPEDQPNIYPLKPILTKDEKQQQKSSLQNRVRKGCNCKKSNCKKKYCECYSANLVCNDQCKCENCYNKKGFPGDNQNSGDQQEHLKIEIDIKDLQVEKLEEQLNDSNEEKRSNPPLSKSSKKIHKEEQLSASDMKIQIKKDIWKKNVKKEVLPVIEPSEQ